MSVRANEGDVKCYDSCTNPDDYQDCEQRMAVAHVCCENSIVWRDSETDQIVDCDKVYDCPGGPPPPPPVPPSLSKSFSQDQVTVGETLTLTFTINNAAESDPATAMSFTDNLPAGLEVASPANVLNSCGGTVTATPGATAISLSGGSVPGNGSCTISVDVTATTPGTKDNTSGPLTTSNGNAPGASDSVDVAPAPVPPAFSKEFSPDTIASGETTTLTFTVDNTGEPMMATGISFTDNLPAGLEVASPANATSACGGTVTANPGSSSISFSGGSVPGSSSCTVTVDILATTSGTKNNTSGPLSTSNGTSPGASDSLEVTAAVMPPVFSKQFNPDTITNGESTTLTFTIDNSAEASDATGMSFTDNLPAGLQVASPANVINSCGGVVTANPGAAVIMFSGGSVLAGATCTISVDVTATTAGEKMNTSGPLTTSNGSAPGASDSLTVNVAPTPPAFSKSFNPDAIQTGETSTVTITIDNSANAVAVTGLSFTDVFPAGLELAPPSNSSNTCGGTLNESTGQVSLSGGSVGAGATCTVTFDVLATTEGVKDNTTTPLDSSAGQSPAASATLTVTQPFELIQYNYVDQPPNQQVEDQLEEARACWNSILPDPLAAVFHNGDPNYTQIEIDVQFVPIDGPFGVLAQAGPNLPSARGTQPVSGVMQVDTADAEDFAAAGILVDVVKHEIAHVLGLGTITSDPVSGPLCSADEYSGANAVAEYSTLTGNAEVFIPMEAGCGHWREDGTSSSVAAGLPNHFSTELNTPQYDAGTPNPNSRMSIAVLQDLGYPNVQIGLADPYVLGQPFRASSQAVKWSCSKEGGKCVIRAKEED